MTDEQLKRAAEIHLNIQSFRDVSRERLARAGQGGDKVYAVRVYGDRMLDRLIVLLDAELARLKEEAEKL